MSRNPSRGPRLAPLQFVEFFNPLDPNSKVLHQFRKELFQKYPGNVRWQILFNPQVGGDQGYYLSKALHVARGMGGFWEMLDQLMLQPSATSYNHKRLVALAQKARINVQGFDVRMQNPMTKIMLDRDMRIGYSIKCSGQSVLYINGAQMKPPWSRAALFRAAKLAFANARAHLQRGLPLSRLHRYLVRNGKQIKAAPGIPDEIKPRMYRNIPLAVFEQTPFLGKEGAPVPVVEFSDFTCAPCRLLYLRLHALMKRLPRNKIRFYFKPYPVLRSIQSRKAVELVAAAQEKGLYWKMVNLLFQKQKLLMKGDYLELARAAGLDTNWIANELDRGSFGIRRYQYLSSGRSLRIRSVPTLFIDGWQMRGAQTTQALLRAFKRELWKAGQPMAVRLRR
jgi:protein-disulfide isomerase